METHPVETLAEAARRVHIDAKTLQYHIDRDRVKAWQSGRIILVDMKSLFEFVSEYYQFRFPG